MKLMGFGHSGRAVIAAAAVMLGTSVATEALATSGSFQLGYSASQRGAGGTGVAMARDANSAAINPALAFGVGHEFDIGVDVFMPFRGYDATGTWLVAPGEVRSERNFFLIPNIAYNMPIDDHSAMNFAIFGAGGNNTTYTSGTGCQAPGFPTGPGVFCAGNTGVDLLQAFASASYAYNMGPLTIGIAPTVAIQTFEAKGLGAFGMFGLSSKPNRLTNEGYDWSFGLGLRGGFTLEVTDALTIAVSGNTKYEMSEFKKYAGLFADHGKFDIPATITAGLAYEISPDVTFLFDWTRIFYDGVAAISNPTITGKLYGASGGPGFGWDNVDIWKFGLEWKQSDQMTWRVGYAYNNNPVGSNDVTTNILAPGVVQHHFTAGGTYKINETDSIDFAAIYVPSSTVSGIEVAPPPAGPNTASKIKLEMHQFDFSINWKRVF
ncbi:MAG: outer membrane protein transport protein [Nitratireductor sp.]|nr:outer membrane protein transport protein [Nitratireductor sp.]